MLLTSPGDNSASLSIDSMQKSGMAEESPKLDGDRVQSNHAHEPSSTNVRAEFDAFEPRLDVHSTGAPTTFTPLPHRQALRLQQSPRPNIELDGLYALRQAAGTNIPRQARESWLSSSTLAKLTATSAVASAEVSSFAAPLSPLRERDIQALSELFWRDDIYGIEADVSQRLLALLPEPCWEDDVFAFLVEFL